MGNCRLRRLVDSSLAVDVQMSCRRQHGILQGQIQGLRRGCGTRQFLAAPTCDPRTRLHQVVQKSQDGDGSGRRANNNFKSAEKKVLWEMEVF